MQSTAPEHSLIGQAFDELRARRQIGLVPFLPAGFPDLQTTTTSLPALESAGATAIEIGFPFSDPIADGPVIQEAFTAALAKGVKVSDVLAAVESVRPKVSLPLIAMLSYSIVFRYGIERFCRNARSAGFDGLILPDLPPPEAEHVCGLVRTAGLDTNLLVAPTTSAARRQEITQLSSGFVYYLSVSGITGERDQFPPDLVQNVQQLKSITDRPVCVGFGIHTPKQIAQLAGIADGAIVGSAYVRRFQQHLGQSSQQLSQIVGQYTQELLSQVR